MIPLTSLEQFEDLCDGYDINGNPGPRRFLIWFSAAWCGPCQKMDKKTLEETARGLAIPFYYCDEVVNRETVERVGIKTFPTFIMYVPKQELGRRMSADTTKVCQWIRKVRQME
jgi:thiol-disulfide isomerase/thioredoxin